MLGAGRRTAQIRSRSLHSAHTGYDLGDATGAGRAAVLTHTSYVVAVCLPEHSRCGTPYVVHHAVPDVLLVRQDKPCDADGDAGDSELVGRRMTRKANLVAACHQARLLAANRRRQCCPPPREGT